MADVDELLNKELAAYTANSNEPHIVVGENRFITIPDELKRIAVKGDHNIETITFDCPRYWDQHDMSKMYVYVVYERSDGESGRYLADNVRVDETDENIMHFDWTIKIEATCVAGDLKIQVCIKTTDSEGYDDNHWSSEINNKAYISDSLDCGNELNENIEPDIINQIITRLDNDLQMASSWNDLEDKPFYDNSTNVEIFNDEITCQKLFNYPQYDFDKWLNEIQDKNKKIIVVHDGETYYLSTTYVTYNVVGEDGVASTQRSHIVGNVNMYKELSIYEWEVFYSNGSGEQHRVENFVYEGPAYEHCPFVFNGDAFYTEESGTHTLQIYDVQGDIKTLDEKVIPYEIARYSDIPDIPELTWDNIVNKPFEDTRAIVDFFNGTYESELQFGAYFIRKTFTSEVDIASLNTVNVIYDGIEYLNLQPNVVDMYGISLLYVGNTCLMSEVGASMLGLEQVDTGEPFCFLYTVSDVDIYTNDTAPTSHTVVVQAINGELKKLDPKFLPDDIGGAGTFVVTITEGSGTGEPESLDKTYVEIKEAYDKGQNIICVGNVTGAIYTLQSISSGGVLFAANRMGGWVGSTEMLVYGYMGITTNDELMYMEDQLVKVEVLQQALEMVQLKQDNNLTTTSKEIVGAINELKTQFNSLVNGNEVEY